jgi:hypothetical protein
LKRNEFLTTLCDLPFKIGGIEVGHDRRYRFRTKT